MDKKINELKKDLNQAVEKKGLHSEEILGLSRELDELIVEYYKENQDILKKNN